MFCYSFIFLFILFTNGQELFNLRKMYRTSLSDNLTVQSAAKTSDQWLNTFNVFSQQTADALTAIVDMVPLLNYESSYNNVDLINKFIAEFKLGQNNEDINLSIGELLIKYNQRVESHKVITEDGYLLNMYRIPSNGTVVFLMHGLFGSADDYVIAGPESGLAYLLAKEGYDVWMGNARGNKHSREHKTLSPLTSEFWNFSWHEIGIRDLPAMIDYILEKTGQSSIKYIGHSQGTTAFFVLTSEKPEYNEKVSVMIALSPVAFMSNLKSPLIRLMAPGSPVVYSVVKSLGLYEFLPDNHLTQGIKKFTCGVGELAEILCSNVVFITVGFDLDQTNATNLPVIFGHIPSGASVKQLVHYAQGINSGKFVKYDYGVKENVILYGSEMPPEYELSNIATAVHLFYSEGDWLADPMDVEKLSKKLINLVNIYKIPYSQFNHLDFLFAKDFRTLVYKKLLHYLQ